MKNIFEAPKTIRYQTRHEIISGLFIFVLSPAASCGIICAGKQSALYNSLSRLAWPENLLWLVYLWGILNVGCFAYATWMTLQAGGYNERWRKAIIGLEIVGGTLMVVGISIPAYVDRGDWYLTLRDIHTAISSVGFFSFYVILLLITGTFFRRNKTQALLSLFVNAFVLIVGVFGLVKVSDPNSYCHVSAPAQILLFDLFNVNAILNYYGVKLIPSEK